MLVIGLTITETALAQERRTHVVRQGETLFSISRQYDVSVDEIRSWNNLRGNQINIGQRLFVAPPVGSRPTTSQPVQQPSRPAPPTPTQPDPRPESGNNEDRVLVRHQVQAGETLFSLSRRYGVTVNDIRTWNNLRSDLLDLGQVLNIYSDGRNIQEVAPASTQTANATQSEVTPAPESSTSIASAYYVVKAGDSLIRIAEQHEISLVELRALNRLQSDRLTVGQVLMVRRPQGLPSVAASTSSTTPQGQFTSYQVRRGERLIDILRRFEMTETELAALNPDIDIRNLEQGLTISVLLPPNITYKNPYRVNTGTAITTSSASETVRVTRYSDLDKGRSTSNGDLYNPIAYTAAHDKLPLGAVIYVENPATGIGFFVLVNDRTAEPGLKLSHAAFDKLGFTLSANNSVIIRS